MLYGASVAYGWDRWIIEYVHPHPMTGENFETNRQNYSS